MRRSVLLASLALLGGCPTERPDDVILYATTAAPPSGRALVSNRDGDERIELSRGVAIAARCWDTCGDVPCADLRVTIDDPALATAHAVYRATGATPEVVLVANAPGRGVVRVRTSCVERVYPLLVTE